MSQILMRIETAKQIKIDIGYTEAKKECMHCVKYAAVSDGATCSLFPDLGRMPVSPRGTCRHWKEQESPCA